MRTLKEIELEFATTCALIGQIELNKTDFLAMQDAKLGPLHDKAHALKQEAAELKAKLEQTQTEKE